jgi:electron transfer flavoprotein beta subunit
MTQLRIAVCVKPVPDSQYYDRITIDPVKKTLVRTGIPTVINELDKHAMEAALTLKDRFGGTVVVFSMAPDDAKEKLYEVLAMGADEAYLISDRAFAGADTFATSYTLACAIRQVGEFHMIFTGNESQDGGTAQVSAQLGEWMNLPHLMNVSGVEYDGEKMTIQTKIENGTMKYEVKLPCVLGITHEANTPRLTNIRGVLKAKSKPIAILRVADLEVNREYIGLMGSPTQPGDIKVPQYERKTVVLDGTPEEIVEQIISIIRKSGITVTG